MANRIYGEWKPSNDCGCGSHHFHSISCEWIESPMMGNGKKFAANAARGVLMAFGIGFMLGERCHDLTHEAIEVLFECDRCLSRFFMTYEIMPDKKEQNFGLYQRQHSPEDKKQIRKPFAWYQRIYERMWDDYHFVRHNCKDWCRDFWSYMNQNMNE